MSTVADQLRQAREARNLTIHQVADITKIRTDHIRALEEGNFDVFSAPVYIRGFVRTYSTLLKLDVPQTMAALDAELGRTEKFSEPPPLTDQKKGPLDFVMLQLSKLNWKVAVVGLVVIIGIVVIVMVISANRNRRYDSSQEVPAGVYRATNTGDRLPVPPARR